MVNEAGTDTFPVSDFTFLDLSSQANLNQGAHINTHVPKTSPDKFTLRMVVINVGLNASLINLWTILVSEYPTDTPITATHLQTNFWLTPRLTLL